MFDGYEEIAVLEQGDDGAVVSIRGRPEPSVLLGPEYLGHLERVSQSASDQLSRIAGRGDVSAIKLLLAEMTTLLKTYDEACNKFHGGVSGAKSLALMLEDLNALRQALNR